MITYPALVAAVAEHELDQLAADSGVPAAAIADLVAGGWAAPFNIRDRLARALDIDARALFRLEEHLEQALASAPTRYVTDPTTLRIVDRAR